MRCPSCHAEIVELGSFCPFCATPLTPAPPDVAGAAEPKPGEVRSPDEAPTSADLAPPTPDEAPTSLDVAEPTPDEAVTSADPRPPTPDEAPTSAERPPTPPPAMSMSDSGQHGRFLPGTTVAERYRIVGLLGRGGMGEVYRADDLKLGQQVALKFLPRRVVSEEGHVERLFDEVRSARKVGHPNVCRVWDVGETDGHHYVSMEYVDGEDLASLLRRIGRLPHDKAVEIARQLCAALAAAHNEGVLHRDLKPANVMLDGRGRVKLTDFGLSAVAEVRAGTPIYMAPEQLAGEEVSVQSDLFALGLVLHELFTGKRVFEAGDFESLKREHERSTTGSLTTTSDLDPAIDRVIKRCLAAKPGDRPKSALAVAAGLPGADPLAAALAAGETPSPEMVAEAGGEGKLHAMYGVPLMALVIIGTLAHAVFMQRLSFINYVPFDAAPAVLDARAQEILVELGFDEEPADTAFGFSSAFAFRNWLSNEGEDTERWEVLREGRPAVVEFWWRSSPSTLEPDEVGFGDIAEVTYLNPPQDAVRGMIGVRLDVHGNLTELNRVPPSYADPEEPFDEFDWSMLFEAAGLEYDAFTPVEPTTTPIVYADRRVAWEGVWPTLPEAALRVEAASFRGRPVSWTLYSPWRSAEPSQRTTPGSGMFETVFVLFILGIYFTVIFGGIYLARRNARLGRGDRRGAGRLAFVVVVEWMVWWAFLGAEFSLLFSSMAMGVAMGGLAWSFYMVVEPIMRRRGPHTMIGWTRLLDGRFSDPLVGRDVLIGCAAGALLSLVVSFANFTSAVAGEPVSFTSWAFLARPFGVVVYGLESVVFMVLMAFGVFMALLLLTVVLRNTWIVAGALAFLVAALGFSTGTGILEVILVAATVFGALAFLLHFGVLPFVIAALTGSMIGVFVVTLDFSGWYAPNVISALVVVFGLAGYGFYRSVEWKAELPALFTEEV